MPGISTLISATVAIALLWGAFELMQIVDPWLSQYVSGLAHTVVGIAYYLLALVLARFAVVLIHRSFHEDPDL